MVCIKKKNEADESGILFIFFNNLTKELPRIEIRSGTKTERNGTNDDERSEAE
jgi:hypothetical protein